MRWLTLVIAGLAHSNAAPEAPPIISVKIVQSAPLHTVGDSAVLCVLARYADGSVKLGRIVQLVRYRATGVSTVARSDARALCAQVLDDEGLRRDIPLTDVTWTRTWRSDGYTAPRIG